MSILPNQTNINQDTYFFLLVDAKVINTSTINANTGLYDKLFVNSISTGSVLVNNISTLTASISSLNTNNISSGVGYISSLTFDSIEGDTASISSILTNTISSGLITANNIITSNISTFSINGNSNFSSSNWWLYPAQGNVSAELLPLPPIIVPPLPYRRIWDLNDFYNINCGNLNAQLDGANPLGTGAVNGFRGNYNLLTTETLNVSLTNETGTVSVYGANKLVGTNALFVEGGVTLTGGGVVHGVTIGALQVGGIDTVRIDVLPAGLALNSATFITANAAGAANVAAGGALSLAGGSYIEYNSDQHYFRNTSAGNDFTDIYVGNIFPADAGSDNLRINGGGQGSRGVALSNVKSLYLDSQNSFITGSPTTSLAVGGVSSVSISTNFVIADYVAGIQQLLGTSTITQDIQLYSDIPLPWDNTVAYFPRTPLSDPISTRVEYLGNNYDCVASNLNLIPNQPIPDWLNSQTYVNGNIAFVAGVGSYRCVATSPPNPLPPNQNFAEWVPFNPTNAISNVWALNNSPITSGITGDKYSYINVGTGIFSNLRLDAISTNSISTGLIISDVIAGNLVIGTSTLTNYIELPSGAPPSAIVGDSNSYIRVGSGYFDNLITSTINVSSINATNISSITAESITTEFLKASYISTGFLSASNISTTSVVADTLYSYSTNTSTINFTFAKGEVIELQGDLATAIALYRNIDGVQQVDTVIATNNTNGFVINSISTIGIGATDEIVLNSGKTVGFTATDGVFVDGPGLNVNSNATISSINTYFISSFNTEVISASDLFANSVFTINLGHPNPLIPTPIFVNNALDLGGNNIIDVATLQTGSIDALNISTNNLSTGSLLVNNIVTNSISTNLISTGRLLSGLDITTPALSTTTISSATIFTNFINAPVNVNFGKNVIPSGNLDLGASGGFRWRNLWVSTISSIHTQTSTLNVQTTLNASTVATDALLAPTQGMILRGNIYPASAGNQFGFFGGAGTNSGGFFGQMNVRSTNTQVLTPDVVGAFSNNIRVQGNLSTQNVFVSSINNKVYPYTSTLNIPFSSFSITGNQAGTPILLYSNVQFANQGFHRISQKTILSKNSGGSSADIHGNIFYTVGAFPSTPSITDGYSALPFVNQDNASTFTTLMTEFYVSTPTTRNILYYDATQNNYTARLYMGTLFDTYTPQFGLRPETIPANIL